MTSLLWNRHLNLKAHYFQYFHMKSAVKGTVHILLVFYILAHCVFSGAILLGIESILVVWFWYVACEQGTVLQYSCSSLRQFYHFLKGIISYTYGSFWTFTRCILELAASENLFQYFCLIYCTCFPQADFIWGITRYLWKIGGTRISPSRVESLCQNGT